MHLYTVTAVLNLILYQTSSQYNSRKTRTIRSRLLDPVDVYYSAACHCVGLSVCPGCSKNEACDLLRLYCSNAQFRGGGGQVHRLYQALWIFFFVLLIRPHRPIKHIKQEARLSQRGCIMLRVIDYFTISLKVIRRSFENCNFQRLYNL